MSWFIRFPSCLINQRTGCTLIPGVRSIRIPIPASHTMTFCATSQTSAGLSVCICGLLTIFTAIQSFSYGSRLAAFGMEINPFNPDALDVSTCGHDCWQKWGEAERKDTLLLTLERALFKFSAPAPPLEVLLKLEPRIGTASPLLTAYSHNIKSRCYPAFYQSYFAALPFPEVLPFSDL